MYFDLCSKSLFLENVHRPNQAKGKGCFSQSAQKGIMLPNYNKKTFKYLASRFYSSVESSTFGFKSTVVKKKKKKNGAVLGVLHL